MDGTVLQHMCFSNSVSVIIISQTITQAIINSRDITKLYPVGSCTTVSNPGRIMHF